MKYLYLFLGINALGSQAMLYFMLVAFSIPGSSIKESTGKILNFFMYALPSLCILAGILMLAGFFLQWKYVYSWILLPIPFAILFIILVFGNFIY